MELEDIPDFKDDKVDWVPYSNVRVEPPKLGETFRVMTMAPPSQALKEYFKEGVESRREAPDRVKDEGEGVLQTTNTRNCGGESRSWYENLVAFMPCRFKPGILYQILLWESIKSIQTKMS